MSIWKQQKSNLTRNSIVQADTYSKHNRFMSFINQNYLKSRTWKVIKKPQEKYNPTWI